MGVGSHFEIIFSQKILCHVTGEEDEAIEMVRGTVKTVQENKELTFFMASHSESMSFTYSSMIRFR